jgi:hypothetical protein
MIRFKTKINKGILIEKSIERVTRLVFVFLKDKENLQITLTANKMINKKAKMGNITVLSGMKYLKRNKSKSKIKEIKAGI